MGERGSSQSWPLRRQRCMPLYSCLRALSPLRGVGGLTTCPYGRAGDRGEDITQGGGGPVPPLCTPPPPSSPSQKDLDRGPPPPGITTPQGRCHLDDATPPLLDQGEAIGVAIHGLQESLTSTWQGGGLTHLVKCGCRFGLPRAAKDGYDETQPHFFVAYRTTLGGSTIKV